MKLTSLPSILCLMGTLLVTTTAAADVNEHVPLGNPLRPAQIDLALRDIQGIVDAVRNRTSAGFETSLAMRRAAVIRNATILIEDWTAQMMDLNARLAILDERLREISNSTARLSAARY